MPRRKSIEHAEWHDRLLEVVSGCHKRNKEAVVQRILKRAGTVRNSLVTRSKKYEVECTATRDDILDLIHRAYGTPCRYCGRILTIQNMVIDHILPISKGGTSNKDNLQVICKTSNSMKGSLEESHFAILLEWLETVPPELKRDISIRLARGIT